MEKLNIQDEAGKLAAEVTPEKIVELVSELRLQQPIENRNSVPVYRLVERLLAEKGYDEITRAKLGMPLREAIFKAVARIPEMEYVDGG